jgi:hypothetical protein
MENTMTAFLDHPARLATCVAAIPVILLAACMEPAMFCKVFEAVLLSVVRSVH